MRFLSLIVLCLLAGISACAPTPTPPQETAFKGIVTSGFEVSAFKPCNSDQLSWFSAPSDSKFWDFYKKLASPPTNSHGYTQVYTEFIGVLASDDPNGYGHLNQYRSEITVQRTIDVQPAPDGKCP